MKLQWLHFPLFLYIKQVNDILMICYNAYILLEKGLNTEISLNKSLIYVG